MKKIIVTLIIILFLFFGINLNAAQEEYNNFNNDGNTENKYSLNEAQLYFESFIYDEGDKINLAIYENFSKKIIDYKVQYEGFEIISEFVIKPKSIVFSINYISDNEKAFLNLHIFLDDKDEFEFHIYGIKKENKIFLSKLSYNDAENTYMEYLYQNDIDKYNAIRNELMPCYDPILPVITMQEYSVLPLSEIPDTYIEGILEWEDQSGNNQADGVNVHPLQYVLVELWDKEPNGERKLAYTYTDKNGYYQFAFKNADQPSNNENGGYDIFIRVLAAGENVKVCKANGSIYFEDIGYYPDIKTGITVELSKLYKMKDFDINDNYVNMEMSQALQISQPVIYATKYVKEMRGSYIAPTIVKYPNNASTVSSTYFDFATRTIFLEEASNTNHPSYSLWDVIMHEYGHHVQMGFGFDDGPGNSHYDVRMADHYKKHFVGFTEEDSKSQSKEVPDCTTCAAAQNLVKERDCKIQGNKIAWEECFPTYFAIAAQQYFAEDLKNIPDVGDHQYNGQGGWFYSLQDSVKLGEDHEGTIQSILYEMYDNSNNDTERDGLSLGHKAMWDLLINSKATTFQEFDTYFRNTHTNKADLIAYGRILANYKLAPSIATANQLDMNGVSFSWSYEPKTDSRFYNNYSYQLNFYDYNKNLICRSDIITSTTHTLDYVLWEDVINSGLYFYVSVTRYENSYPTTSYEGEWTKYSRPSIIELKYTSNITKTIGTGEYHWYSFTSPQTATYTFKTYGDMDTYGELFSMIKVGQSTYGRLTYEDDIDDEDHNFMISYTVNKGQTIYLRVRGFNWTGTGEYTIYMYSLDHQHDYTYSYSKIDDNYHYATCFCGKSTKELHNYQAERLGYRCILCKNYTEGPIIVIQSNGKDVIIYLEDKNYLEELTSKSMD